VLGLKHSGKNWNNPLLGGICLLTTGVLIRVRPSGGTRNRCITPAQQSLACVPTSALPSPRFHPGEDRVDIRHKLYCLVHGMQLNGVVQEEERRLVLGMSLHLAEQRLLLLPMHCAVDLRIQLAEFWLLHDPHAQSNLDHWR
jgi:hypothetical protein